MTKHTPRKVETSHGVVLPEDVSKEDFDKYYEEMYQTAYDEIRAKVYDKIFRERSEDITDDVLVKTSDELPGIATPVLDKTSDELPSVAMLDLVKTSDELPSVASLDLVKSSDELPGIATPDLMKTSDELPSVASPVSGGDEPVPGLRIKEIREARQEQIKYIVGRIESCDGKDPLISFFNSPEGMKLLSTQLTDEERNQITQALGKSLFAAKLEVARAEWFERLVSIKPEFGRLQELVAPRQKIWRRATQAELEGREEKDEEVSPIDQKP